jgi:hypothetical protein
MRPNLEPLTTESRRWRAWLLVGCGVGLILSLYATFLGTPLEPWCGTLGFSANIVESAAAFSISDVTPGGPAALAGLRVGDRINLSDLPFRERWRLKPLEEGAGCTPVGERLQYLVHRGTQTRTVVILPRRDASWEGWNWIFGIASVWGLLFAALLAARRPDLVQARLLSLMLLLYFGSGALSGGPIPWLPFVDFVLVWLGGWIFDNGSYALIAVLSATFGRPLSPIRRALTITAVVLALLRAVPYRIFYPAFYLFALPVTWPTHVHIGGPVIFCSLLCAVAAVIASRGSDRQRAFWILVSIAPLWIVQGLLLFGAIDERLRIDINTIPAIVSISMPVGLTYAVLSRRVFDAGYVVNRAIVFAGMSLVVLGVFVVVEWALSTWISNASHTTSIVINVAVALALGLSLRFVHRWFERFVDRVFFRKRHDDETALRRFAREATFISDKDTLLDRTTKTVSQHTDASSVDLDLLSDGAPENDPAVLALRTWHEPVDLHRYETVLKGEMAFPMVSRGALVGVLACGAKRSGESYAPDEIDALEAVAHGVGTALDMLQSRDGDGRHLLDVQKQILDIQVQILGELRTQSTRGHGDRPGI